uniref:Uncharacterized protein n=1 Tax=Podarcis muralis TaxID=64176 RepID=A0A670JA28_PODMU
MGCCFSKELNSKNEKMSLLQKSTEEETSENGISKTLTSILETMERKELHVIQEAVSGTPAVHNNCVESVKYPSGHCAGIAEGGHNPSRSFNLYPHNARKVLNGYGSLQECKRMEDTDGAENLPESSSSNVQCVNNAGSNHINSNNETGSTVAGKPCRSLESTSSCVPVAVSQGSIFPKALSTCGIKGKQVMGECLLVQDEVDSVKSNCSAVGSGRADRETAASSFAYLDIDRPHISTRDEFYSICIVDDDLRMDLEEGQAIVHGETALEVESSAVQEMYSMTWPGESGKELLVPKKPVQVPVDFSALKDESPNIIKDSLLMPKSEMGVKAPVGLVNRDHRLNTDRIAAEVLRAQAHGEDLTKNRTQEMNMVDSSRIFVNESLGENNNSPTLVHLEKDMKYSLQLESRTHAWTSLFNSEHKCLTEDVKSESNENQNTEGENSKQLLGSLKFSSEFEDTTGDFLSVGQNNTKNQSQVNRQNFTGSTNEFWRVSACSDKKTPNFSEQFNPELLLKYEDVSDLGTFCSQGDLKESTIKTLPTSESVAFEAEIPHVSEFTSYEDGNFIRAAQQNLSQIDNIPSEMSDLTEGSWGSEETLTFSKPLNVNVNEYERIQNENCLEVQVPHHLSKKDGKTNDYSSSLYEDNSCCVSLAHSEASEMDLNDEQCKLWNKCTFHRLEDQLSAGTDPHKLIATAEEPVNGLKWETHHERKTHSEIETKADSENFTVQDDCMLNGNNDLMQKLRVSSNMQEKPLGLEESLSILQIDKANSQLETERLPASVDESDARNVKIETSHTETSTRSRGEKSGFYGNSSLPKQSIMETMCPLRPLNSEVSIPCADILAENAKDSAPQNSQQKLNVEVECASRSDAKDSLTCTDAGGICIDPKQVDKYAATPSYEIPLASVNDQECDQGNAKHVLDLMEDILKESDNTHKMDMGDSQGDPLCPSAPLSSLFSSTKFTDDQEYLMGYLWINSSFNKTDSSCSASEALQNETGDVTVPSFEMGGYPYQLLVQQNSDIWGWQDRDEGYQCFHLFELSHCQLLKWRHT